MGGGLWCPLTSTSTTITSQQVWQAFTQESIRTIATDSSQSFELIDNLSISEVTGKAYDILGHNGSINAATHHLCSECTHAYKQSMDQTTVPDAADVKMVVLDGIVMGPMVSLNIIKFYLLKTYNIYIALCI